MTLGVTDTIPLKNALNGGYEFARTGGCSVMLRLRLCMVSTDACYCLVVNCVNHQNQTVSKRPSLASDQYMPKVTVTVAGFLYQESPYRINSTPHFRCLYSCPCSSSSSSSSAEHLASAARSPAPPSQRNSQPRRPRPAHRQCRSPPRQVHPPSPSPSSGASSSPATPSLARRRSRSLPLSILPPTCRPFSCLAFCPVASCLLASCPWLAFPRRIPRPGSRGSRTRRRRRLGGGRGGWGCGLSRTAKPASL